MSTAVIDTLQAQLLGITTTVRGRTVRVDEIRLDEAHLQLPGLTPIPARVCIRMRVMDGPFRDFTANIWVSPEDIEAIVDSLASIKATVHDLVKLLAVGMERDITKMTDQPCPDPQATLPP
jgi:hypothetical protein